MATELVDRETGEVIDFPQVRIDSRFVVKQQGRDYVLSDGLIDGLHALSGGYFDVSTEIVQLPTPDNGHLAVCAAKVTVFSPDADGRVLRVATGLGDASPQSVNRMILPHLIRMAETRALSRALRTLLNVGAVAFEELGPQADDGDAPRGPQTRPEGRDGATGSANRVPPTEQAQERRGTMGGRYVPEANRDAGLAAGADGRGQRGVRSGPGGNAAPTTDAGVPALPDPPGRAVSPLPGVRSGAPPDGEPDVPPVPFPGAPVAASPARSVNAEHIVVGDRTYSREEVVVALEQRLKQAREAGLAVSALPPDWRERTPLSIIVGTSQELRRRLEQRGQGGSGK